VVAHSGEGTTRPTVNNTKIRLRTGVLNLSKGRKNQHNRRWVRIGWPGKTNRKKTNGLGPQKLRQFNSSKEDSKAGGFACTKKGKLNLERSRRLWGEGVRC